MNVLPLEYLSHSRLACYRSCSLQFRFKYIDRLAPAFTPGALAFGVAFHRAVEAGLVGLMTGELPRPVDLVKVFTACLDEQAAATPIKFGEKEDRDLVIEMAKRMLTAWTVWPRPRARIVAVEHEFRVPLADWLPPLIGRIDLVEMEDGGQGTVVNVIDIKSSRNRWSADDLVQHAGQLALYRAGIAELTRELGLPVRLGFEVVTKAKSPIVERLYLEDGGESLERQVRTATLVLEAVERGIYMPSRGWQCSSCPFQEACKGW